MAFIWDPFSTYRVNYDLELSLHCPFLQALLFRILLTSVRIGTCSQFQQLPFSNETLVTASGWGVYFFRNSLPVQSFISFSSVTFSVKQTLRAAPAGWKCPPLICTALAQCNGQVWNYAFANKWHPTHCTSMWGLLGGSVQTLLKAWHWCMMTSSNGNIFRVTGHLCGEFAGHLWIPSQMPVTRLFYVFFDLLPN